jgi:uncharacterized protein YdiU (UPF0061 family)
MNTDNMSILGLTIDYGPYGWLEDYDPAWTPNTTDAAHRRYRYGQQGQIAQWNLVQLANAIAPLIGEVEPLQAAFESFARTYDAGWQDMMARKIGLAAFDAATDGALITDLLELLQGAETDMTVFFRRLAAMPLAAAAAAPAPAAAPAADFAVELDPWLGDAYYVPAQLTDAHRAKTGAWLRRYAERARRDGLDDAARRQRMDAVNPKYVLRNYLAQMAIDKAEREGDFAMIHELLETLRRPYDEQPAREEFAAKRPDWARHRPGCSMLSCSS